MLIQFTVTNFRSFKEPATLSLVTANRNARETEINKNNTFKINDNLSLLRSAVIYGPNASGKSNLIQALGYMREFILSSANDSQPVKNTGAEPFLLNIDSRTNPSTFEVIFIVDDTQYRYGFKIDSQQVISEWLFSVPSKKEATLFVRENQNIKVSPKYFKEGRGLQKRVRSNALFLPVCALFNGALSNKLMLWFQRLAIISGLDDMKYRMFTIKQVYSGKNKADIINLLKSLDIDILNAESIKLEDDQLQFMNTMPDEIRNILVHSGQEFFYVKTMHPVYDNNGIQVETTDFDMDKNESLGTQKVFYLAGPILDVLENGRILVIDEMEARLHPFLTKKLISLFNSDETNSKNAQLIITTHDTNLLTNKVFRRDQIWFIDKDQQGSSFLYSLAEIKVANSNIRNDASFDSDYLKGRYGAIPIIDNNF